MIKGIVLSIIFGWKVREEEDKKNIKKSLERRKRETHSKYHFIIISAFIL